MVISAPFVTKTDLLQARLFSRHDTIALYNYLQHLSNIAYKQIM